MRGKSEREKQLGGYCNSSEKCIVVYINWVIVVVILRIEF